MRRIFTTVCRNARKSEFYDTCFDRPDGKRKGGSDRVSERSDTWCGPDRRHRAGPAASGPPTALTQGFSPANASHDTLGFQLVNVPLGLSFHAQTQRVERLEAEVDGLPNR